MKFKFPMTSSNKRTYGQLDIIDYAYPELITKKNKVKPFFPKSSTNSTIYLWE